LTSGEGTDHDQSSTHTGEETTGAKLTGHLDESGGGSLSWGTLGLVDLGKQGVGGLRDNGSGHTSDQTSRQVESGLLSASQGVLGLASGSENLLNGDLEDGELGHGVWDLLEQDGTETGRECQYPEK
jgi:hypothetical protein